MLLPHWKLLLSIASPKDQVVHNIASKMSVMGISCLAKNIYDMILARSTHSDSVTVCSVTFL